MLKYIPLSTPYCLKQFSFCLFFSFLSYMPPVCILLNKLLLFLFSVLHLPVLIQAIYSVCLKCPFFPMCLMTNASSKCNPKVTSCEGFIFLGFFYVCFSSIHATIMVDTHSLAVLLSVPTVTFDHMSFISVSSALNMC
jgi:hypothetical protein